MNTQIIYNMIKDAIRIEKDTGNLATVLRQIANLNGAHPTPEEVAGGIKFIQQYIEHVPVLMDEIASAAQNGGVIDQVMPILDVAEQYFITPNDLIPDHLGLLGLMDDAYLAHSLIQGLSDRYRNQAGGMLLPADMTSVNYNIRNIIGEPLASILDASASGALNTPTFQQTLAGLINFGPGLDLAGPDPIWGNASIEEIANVRLGAMGVI